MDHVRTGSGTTARKRAEAEAAGAPGECGGTARRQVGLALAGTLAAAALLRAANPYRPFPSIDDFAYIPMALARLDGHLFTRDVFVRDTPLHVPLLPPLVAVLRATTGLELGFWLITVLLSVLTLAGLWRWMRALGVPGALLPIAGVLTCAGAVTGLGRGDYDGLFGNAFHLQWAALCALVWAYDGVLRGGRRQAAACLVFSFLLHPVVGAHGAGVLACGLLFRTPRIVHAGPRLVPLAAAACATIAAIVFFSASGPAAEVIARLPEVPRALLFRLPHEYEVDRFKTTLLLVVVAAGIAAIGKLVRRRREAAVTALMGLLLGHLLLLALYVVLFDARIVVWWSPWTVVPFQLSLSRTTPLLLALSGVAIAAALEARFFAESPLLGGQGLRSVVTAAIQLAAVVCIAVFEVRWSWHVAACCLVAGATAVASVRQVGHRALMAAWAGVFLGGMVLFARSAPLWAPIDDQQKDLFSWVRSQTLQDALFIVPPGFQEFRTYAQRSIYVDFKTITPGSPGLIHVWRRRLEEVAAPDRLAREARGWEGVAEWDRTYANRNTPERLGWLLKKTSADYFVWDRQGLRIPPFVVRDQTPDPSLAVAFENARYKVYRLAASGS